MVLYIPASAGLDRHQQFDQKGATRLEWEAGISNASFLGGLVRGFQGVPDE